MAQFSLLNWFCSIPFLSIPLGIVSIILGFNHKKETGTKTIGTILGIISLILTTIFIILFIFFISLFFYLDYKDNYYNDNYKTQEESNPNDTFLNKYLTYNKAVERT